MVLIQKNYRSAFGSRLYLKNTSIRLTSFFLLYRILVDTVKHIHRMHSVFLLPFYPYFLLHRSNTNFTDTLAAYREKI